MTCSAGSAEPAGAGVPKEVMFATKPQLAGALLDRAQSLGIRAAFVAGDEVYSGRELRRGIRQHGIGYVMGSPLQPRRYLRLRPGHYRR